MNYSTAATDQSSEFKGTRFVIRWALIAVGLCAGWWSFAHATLPTDFTNEIVLSNLTEPVTIVELPSGEMLVGELPGRIVLVNPLVDPATSSTYMQIPNVDDAGEKGLLSLAIDPNFAINNYIYAYYHNLVADRPRISRFTHNVNQADPMTEFVIWEDSVPSSNQVIPDHWGGAFGFGPDGYLYLAIGDKKDFPLQAQDLTLSAGKIIRLDTSGADIGGVPWVQGSDNPLYIPATNPFIDGPGGQLDEIWALGLRNPFRGGWDFTTGRFFISEVGGNINSGANASWEDIHVATTADGGTNFGWPDCEGPTCAGTPPANYSAPIYSIQHPASNSIIVGPVYTGTQYPSTYHDALFITDVVRGWIRYLTFDAAGNVSPSVPTGGFVLGTNGEVGNPVASILGSDGALYFANFFAGELRRVTYDSGNAAPVITQAEANVTSSMTAPLTVTFTGAATDLETPMSLTYTWDFGDGNSSNGAVVSYTYSSTGTYDAVLRVSDGDRIATSDPIEIQIGIPPVATITAPPNSSDFVAGNVIQIRGIGSDSDGSLTNDSYKWSIRFQHNEHFHPTLTNVAGFPCAPTGSTCLDYTIASSGHDFSDSTAYEITLNVTDADGLAASDQITILPDKVDLSFSSDVPGGITFALDQLPRPGPFTIDTLKGFTHTITAPATVAVGGDGYEFQVWSNGPVTNTQTITVPLVNTNYMAVYSNIGPVTRVTAGLQAMYTFVAGSGNTVMDVSGVGTPLDLTIANPGNTTWNSGTLTVNASTEINSIGGANKINSAMKASNALTVEAWITPANTTQTGPSRIVSLSNDPSNRNVTLGQGGSGAIPGTLYDVRLRTTSTGNNGSSPSLSSNPGTLSSNLMHVVYTRDAAGVASIYLDGTLSETGTIAGAMSNWVDSYGLVLANEQSGDRPWLGTFHLVAFYDRALDATEVAQNFTAGDSAGVPNQSPVAVNDVVSAPSRGVARISVLANDSDSDGALVPSSVTIFSDVSHGRLLNNADGTLTYIHNGSSTSDSFQYTVEDNDNATSNVADVTISIAVPGNRPPVAANDSATISSGGTVAIEVLANDIDLDGSIVASTLVVTSPVSSGSIQNNGSGTITYTHNGTGSTSDTFQYTVGDNAGGVSNTATVEISIAPAMAPPAPDGNPPVARADNATLVNGGSAVINVLANDSDDGTLEPNSVMASTASHGSLFVNSSDGAITYRHDRSGEGVDSFTYTVQDDQGMISNSATVSLSITSLEAPPVATNDTATLTNGGNVSIAVLSNDTPIDTLDPSSVLPSEASRGVVTLNTSNGLVNYSHDQSGPGTDTFTYTVADDRGIRSMPATVRVVIDPSLAQPDRTTDGLLALYTFNEGSGNTVTDVSGSDDPLNLMIANPANVSWGIGTLNVDESTQIESTRSATNINNAVANNGTITVEAWIQPSNTLQSGPARILSLSNTIFSRNLTLGQGISSRDPGNRYNVRFRTTTAGTNGSRPSLSSPIGSATVALTHVVYTRSANGAATMYINGALTATSTIGGSAANWAPGYTLILANEKTGERPWLGSFDLVAVYDRVLTSAEIAGNYAAGTD